MSRQGNTNHGSDGGRGAKSPDERYREFARENAAWDQRVKKSIAKIDGGAPQAPEKSEARTRG